MKRREFIKDLSMGSAALGVGITSGFSKPAPAVQQKIKLNKGDTILFQGDSITDAFRDKSSLDCCSYAALGNGYALLAASQLLKGQAAKKLRIYNKGVGRNNIRHLAGRWQTDCLDLKPTVLSILIGVNDYWHTLGNSGYDGTPQTFKDDYRALLDKTLTALPDLKLIIGEPFALLDVKYVTQDWFPLFDAYRAVAREISEEYRTCFIPYHDIFQKATALAPGDYWTEDGVHTTLAGAELMADAWLRVFSDI